MERSSGMAGLPHPRIEYWGAPHRTTQGGRWVGRRYLTADSRKLVVGQLLAALQQNEWGFLTDSELQVLAEAFEQRSFSSSASYHDYLVRISSKCLSLEERGRRRRLPGPGAVSTCSRPWMVVNSDSGEEDDPATSTSSGVGSTGFCRHSPADRHASLEDLTPEPGQACRASGEGEAASEEETCCARGEARRAGEGGGGRQQKQRRDLELFRVGGSILDGTGEEAGRAKRQRTNQGRPCTQQPSRGRDI